jgi:hypothetical protein
VDRLVDDLPDEAFNDLREAMHRLNQRFIKDNSCEPE